MGIKYRFLLISFFLITSCGGGGGGDGGTDVGNQNPRFLSFSISTTSANIGDRVVISWQSENTQSCSASGDWTGLQDASGTWEFTPSSGGTYTFGLSCSGAGGSTETRYVTLAVSDSGGVGAEIYDIDQESYCKTPSNENSSNNYWLEEFNSPTLDDNTYTYQEGNGWYSSTAGQFIGGWGNNEIQYYTSCRVDQETGGEYSKDCDIANNTTENAFIENGVLKIQPIFWSPDNGETLFNDPYCLTSGNNCDTWSGTWEYTSARIMTSSKKIFSPGIELTVCFKLPQGNGHWPAIWMMPQGFIEETTIWPNDGEIDIMEHMINLLDWEVQSTVHFGNSSNDKSSLFGIKSVPSDVNFVDKFHSITMKWEQDAISFYMDTQTSPFHSVSKFTDQAFASYTYPFNDSFYLIFNVAAGGNAGGSPDTSAYCHNINCSNLSDPGKGQLQIDFIESKPIN